MRRKAIEWLMRALDWLRPKPDLAPQLRLVSVLAADLTARNDDGRRQYMEHVAELVEARQMAGAGPWRVGPAALEQTDSIIGEAYRSFDQPQRLRETMPPISAGAFGDMELALQNVEWRREVNFSWLEFSRWGIQQIILISRLYYIKNPIIRRLIDVCAAYVFARGVEISSPDEDLNGVIDQFLAANPKTFGQRALVNGEKRRDYDGNIFWVFFDDKQDKGACTVRTIDATEIQEIETDPDDTDTPWYYHRVCTQREFDPADGAAKLRVVKMWYPALDYEPSVKPEKINGDPVMWGQPVYHSKCGDVGKWNFGCPRAYPALDWAREARRFLEACASVKQSNAQIAREITTKGGQQAIQGIKGQLQTTVGPSAQLWDTNPPAVAGATWVAGTGTEMKLVQQRGMSDSPEEVRRYILMCCMVFGVPETFTGDVSTGNLATATSLDRPTETVMLEKQEIWREDLMVLTLHGLNVSKDAPSGKLRESLVRRGLDPGKVTIRECARVRSKDGRRMEYAKLERRGLTLYEGKREVPETEMVVRVNFPAIREGDMNLLTDATVKAMTLGSAGGTVCGIDLKAGVRKLYDVLGFDDGDELTEEQFPDGEYDPNRANQEEEEEPEEEPAGKRPAASVDEAVARLNRAVESYERGVDS